MTIARPWPCAVARRARDSAARVDPRGPVKVQKMFHVEHLSGPSGKAGEMEGRGLMMGLARVDLLKPLVECRTARVEDLQPAEFVFQGLEAGVGKGPPDLV